MDAGNIMDAFWASVDSRLAVIWLLLAACSYAVKYIPFLRTIGDHGKQVQLSAEATNPSSGIWLWIDRCMHIMVPKQLFTVMYLYGLVFMLAVLFLLAHNPVNGIFPVWDNRNIVLVLWTMHLFRRLLECIFITKYGTSEMHVFGFLVGIVHYSLVPVSFFAVNVEANSRIQLLANHVRFPAILIFVGANIFQFRFHYMLYSLKLRYTQHDGLPYALPVESFFRYVSCPHYTAEIFIYFSLWLLTLPAISVSVGCLVFWVASNLGVVAGRQHLYYCNTFPDKVPKNWNKLLPGIF